MGSWLVEDPVCDAKKEKEKEKELQEECLPLS
jgi:hypothetical protein